MRPRPGGERLRRPRGCAARGQPAARRRVWGCTTAGGCCQRLLVGREPGARRGDRARPSTAFAEPRPAQGRRCSSIVGPADAVARPLGRGWSRLGPGARGPAAAAAACSTDRPPLVGRPAGTARPPSSDLLVITRRAWRCSPRRSAYSPVAARRRGALPAPVAELVRAGRTLRRGSRHPHGREVVFKAELGVGHPASGARSRGCGSNPRCRGQGLAAPAMAAVVDGRAREVAPIVSLYVNDYNVRAVRTYERVGFRAGRRRSRPSCSDHQAASARSRRATTSLTTMATHPGSSTKCSHANRSTSQPARTSSS